MVHRRPCAWLTTWQSEVLRNSLGWVVPRKGFAMGQISRLGVRSWEEQGATSSLLGQHFFLPPSRIIISFLTLDFPSGNSFILLMTLWRSGRLFSRCWWINLGTDDLVKQIHSIAVQKIQPKQRYLSKDFAHITQQYLILYVIQCTELFFKIRSRNN